MTNPELAKASGSTAEHPVAQKHDLDMRDT
jgi:hypothetical protein